MNASNYYECHITFIDPGNGQALVEEMKWKYSVIRHDPLLGEGTRAYATKHFSSRHSLESVWSNMQHAADQLRSKGISVLRCKVEGILRDERY